MFAAAHIPARTVVDVCPVLVLDPCENEQHIQTTVLHHYTYTWPTPGHSRLSTDSPPWTVWPRTQAIVLGLGSLFNHSSHPRRHNTGWTRNIAAETVTYVTLRDVDAGEELCISYGSRLTFDNVEEGLSDDEAAGDELPDTWSILNTAAGLLDDDNQNDAPSAGRS